MNLWFCTLLACLAAEVPLLNFTQWLSAGGRNLIKAGDYRTVRTLHIGPEQIIKCLDVLPTTVHDISGPGEKFCLDAFPVALGQTMGLLLCVHGEFMECWFSSVPQAMRITDQANSALRRYKVL